MPQNGTSHRGLTSLFNRSNSCGPGDMLPQPKECAGWIAVRRAGYVARAEPARDACACRDTTSSPPPPQRGSPSYASYSHARGAPPTQSPRYNNNNPPSSLTAT
ncbi:hypothetical protein EXIGLDRAFT_763471 [Exidia glandulosa HHB12029]|uniref:Uncharacterized protein n=1 Tax=Exidia glandulosa HHB12029 TaxID=1314781 RepID=A0A166B741_EXIGL|nr:hypothetical protein EXIGLDRAFT_763471 [Exidia glandulosa HHB12029]